MSAKLSPSGGKTRYKALKRMRIEVDSPNTSIIR